MNAVEQTGPGPFLSDVSMSVSRCKVRVMVWHTESKEALGDVFREVDELTNRWGSVAIVPSGACEVTTGAATYSYLRARVQNLSALCEVAGELSKLDDMTLNEITACSLDGAGEIALRHYLNWPEGKGGEGS